MESSQSSDVPRKHGRWRAPTLAVGVLVFTWGLMWFSAASRVFAHTASPKPYLESNAETALGEMYMSGMPVSFGATLISLALYRRPRVTTEVRAAR
jgi:hypothetical protein